MEDLLAMSKDRLDEREDTNQGLINEAVDILIKVHIIKWMLKHVTLIVLTSSIFQLEDFLVPGIKK